MPKVVGCFLFALALPAFAQTHEIGANESTWKSHLAAGSTVQIRDGLGSIEVVKSEGDAFTVEVKRGNEGTSPRVVVVEGGKSTVICADWTTAAGQPSDCRANSKLFPRSLKNIARADLTIAVPEGTNVEAFTGTGSIRIAPLHASTRAEAYEADIRLTADGDKVYADNLRGVIDVTFPPEMSKETAKLSTLEGKIRIVTPESRLMHCQIYGNGVINTAYELEGPVHGEKKGDRFLYRGIPASFEGFFGPPKGKVWTKVEVYIMNAGAELVIDK